jgi:DNA-binding NarL/FixJ family response regulator
VVVWCVWSGCPIDPRPLVNPPVPLFSMPTVVRTYLVEDSAVIRENLIATLEDLTPVRVVGTAADEPTAVRWLTQARGDVDLVIVDLFLDRGSGLGVLRAAQNLASRHRTIVLSNFASPEIQRACLALGADRVFDKSHDIDALLLYCCGLESLPA